MDCPHCLRATGPRSRRHLSRSTFPQASSASQISPLHKLDCLLRGVPSHIDCTLRHADGEDWHGRDLPYAECLTDEGTGSRVWFHRDKPGTPMGVTGRILPDALF